MMQTLAGFEKRLQDFQDGTKDLLMSNSVQYFPD